jgi:hypothetical protein
MRADGNGSADAVRLNPLFAISATKNVADTASTKIHMNGAAEKSSRYCRLHWGTSACL